jgi:hypothetical protein
MFDDASTKAVVIVTILATTFLATVVVATVFHRVARLLLFKFSGLFPFRTPFALSGWPPNRVIMRARCTSTDRAPAFDVV